MADYRIGPDGTRASGANHPKVGHSVAFKTRRDTAE